jgi:hypothetical protein
MRVLTTARPASPFACHHPHQVFCGNFEYDAEERDIVKLFEKYGPVEKIDMKTGEPWRVAVSMQDVYKGLSEAVGDCDVAESQAPRGHARAYLAAVARVVPLPPSAFLHNPRWGKTMADTLQRSFWIPFTAPSLELRHCPTPRRSVPACRAQHTRSTPGAHHHRHTSCTTCANLPCAGLLLHGREDWAPGYLPPRLTYHHYHRLRTPCPDP